MNAQSRPDLASPQTSSSASGGYILTKVSASGCRYYFTGKLVSLEIVPGQHVLTAETGYLPGDAFVYQTKALPEGVAKLLNRFGISDAPWEVETTTEEIASPA